MLLSNSLLKHKSKLALTNNKATLYVCGITPYSSPHIGHGRCYISFDLLYRLLTAMHIDVTYCRNITDIDDKLLHIANERYGSIHQYPQLVAEYMDEFWHCLEQLNCKRPQHEPRVTDHIPDIITFISRLIDKGYAYQVDHDVYFSVEKVKNYGELSGQNIEQVKKNHRVTIENKQNPLDFVLWKSEEEPFWQSPWGNGRPGWHVECSVMASKYLGETIDLHGGGLDLIFPHHENEKILAEVCFEKPFVNCWMHNGLVTVNKEKMSKSLGNFILLKDALAQYHPQLIRYFFVQHHYKSPLEWSDALIESAKASYQRIAHAFAGATLTMPFEEQLSYSTIKIMHEAICDDMNTPVVFATIFTNLQTITNNTSLKDAVASYCHQILGLTFLVISTEPTIKADNEQINHLLHERELARKNKDFKKADALREQLHALGYIVQDHKL